MSVVDRALERAYRLGGQAPASSTGIRPPEPAVDRPESQPPTPHFVLAAGVANSPSPDGPDREFKTNDEIALGDASGRPAAGIAKAEAAPSTVAADAGLAPVLESDLDAAYEVERFFWPETPDALVAAAGPEFNLLAQELISGARRGRKVLLIASRTRGEGCSTVTLALAKLIGKKGQRVALVDADFCRPSLADLLGVSPSAGWDDVLAGDQPLEEALIESLSENITLLPFRAPAVDAPAVYRRPALADGLRRLKDAFDLVCLDAGPFAEVLGPAGGSLAWAMAGIDAALLVRDVRKTTVAQLDAAGRQLETAGVARWSAIENYVS